MDQSQQPRIELVLEEGYRERYANSVQVRVNLWDFFLSFGTVQPTGPETLQIRNSAGFYLSPQQAKALANLLNHNLAQYEAAFGEIRLEAQPGAPVPGNGSLQ